MITTFNYKEKSTYFNYIFSFFCGDKPQTQSIMHARQMFSVAASDLDWDLYLPALNKLIHMPLFWLIYNIINNYIDIY